MDFTTGHDGEQSRTGRGLTIGVLGAGRVGTAVARQAVRAGHSVTIATARPAAEIRLLTEVIVPGARAVDSHELRGADLIVLAAPLHRYRSFDVETLRGHIVVDVTNYWSEVDGRLDEFEGALSTSEVLADFLGHEVTLVKTLNHIGYGFIETDARPAGADGRRALAMAGDDADAKAAVADFVDSLGFDVVDAGPLSAGRAFENGTPIFDGEFTAPEIERLLHEARLPAGV
ncbi:MAG: NAD(P)-binding domain-containing protein [Nesterenkonia sp.]|nr:NAD(P)-binding domain-containing protein [Nesterenkonia sp.]